MGMRFKRCVDQPQAYTSTHKIDKSDYYTFGQVNPSIDITRNQYMCWSTSGMNIYSCIGYGWLVFLGHINSFNSFTQQGNA